MRYHYARIEMAIKHAGIECRVFCPELDVASQGNTVGEARANLMEAVELFFEVASAEEVRRRLL